MLKKPANAGNPGGTLLALVCRSPTSQSLETGIVILFAVALYLALAELIGRALACAAAFLIATDDPVETRAEAPRVVRMQLQRLEALRDIAREAVRGCEVFPTEETGPLPLTKRRPDPCDQSSTEQ